MKLMNKMKSVWMLLICAVVLPCMANAQPAFAELKGVLTSRNQGDFTVEGTISGTFNLDFEKTQASLLQMNFFKESKPQKAFFLTNGATLFFFGTEESPVDPSEIFAYAFDLSFLLKKGQAMFTGSLNFGSKIVFFNSVLDRDLDLSSGCLDLHIFTPEGRPLLIDATSTSCVQVSKIPT